MTTATATFDSRRMAQARKRTLRRTVRRALVGAGALAVVAAIVVAWLPRPVPAEIALVTRGPLRVTVDEDGVARVKHRYVVSAPIAGSVGRVELQPGDWVQQGDVIVSIVPAAPALLDTRARATAQARLAQALAAERQAHAQVDHAQVSLDLAASELKRQQQLFARGAGVQQALDQAESAHHRGTHELDAQRFATRVAAYEVEMARAALARMSDGGGARFDVTAPVAGNILKVQHESEGIVQPGTPLFEIGDRRAVEIAVDVLTSDAVHVHSGAEVEIDRWGGAPLRGRVERVEPSAFTKLSALGVEEQRVNVVVYLTSPHKEWSDLGDGYRVETHIAVWYAPDVVKVPTSALFRHEDGWALFRVDGGRARFARVEVGQRTAREAQILRGVAPGERVVMHPSDRIRDGVKVSAP